MFPKTKFIEAGHKKEPQRRNSRPKKAFKSVPVPVNLIATVVQHVLQYSVVTVGRVVARQVRGSFTGLPLPPPLSVDTVALPELRCHETLGHYRPSGSTWDGFRYVANRFLTFVSRNGQNLAPQKLLTSDFYTEPVRLLPEPDLVGLQLRWGVACGPVWTKCIVHGFEHILHGAAKGKGRKARRILPIVGGIGGSVMWQWLAVACRLCW